LYIVIYMYSMYIRHDFSWSHIQYGGRSMDKTKIK